MIKKLSLLLSSFLPFLHASAQSKEKPIPSLALKKPIEVYGHRGARSFSPENTIPAYRTALKVGVHWIDADIVITKDNQIVAYHDLWINPDFTRKMNSDFFEKNKKDFLMKHEGKKIDPFLIYQMTFDQLQKYDVGKLNPESSYSKFFPDQISVPHTTIPKLSDVVDYVDRNSDKQVRFQLEIKTDTEHPDWSPDPKKFADLLYALLKEKNLITRVEVQAFDWRYLKELQKRDTRIKTAYLIDSTEIERMKKDHSLPKTIKDLGGACYEPEDVALTKEDLDQAHKLGLKVVVWTWPEHLGTAFDPDVINRLIDWGVDGIITDDPGRLNSILAARGHPVPQNHPNAN